MVTGPHDIITAIVERLVERYQPERIVLFGSYASGQPHADSDIDLLIVKRTNQPFYQRLTAVRQIVSDVRRGHAFEPLVLTPDELDARLSRGDQFIEEIVTHGTPLHDVHG